MDKAAGFAREIWDRVSRVKRLAGKCGTAQRQGLVDIIARDI
jgi:hypothetical protein